jgi:hypothetical protein
MRPLKSPSYLVTKLAVPVATRIRNESAAATKMKPQTFSSAKNGDIDLKRNAIITPSH